MGVKGGRQDKLSALWSGDGRLLRVLDPGTSGGINGSCAFHPREHLVAIGSWLGFVRIYSTLNGEVLAKLDHPGRVQHLRFHPNGRWLLTAAGVGTVRLWSLGSTDLVYPPVSHGPNGLSCATLSPDGSQFATASRDGSVRLWETETGKPIGPTLLHRGRINDLAELAFGSDGQWLITGGADGTVRLWSLAAGEELGPPYKLSRSVRCVAIDPTGEHLLAGGEQPEVLLAPLPALSADTSRDFQTEIEVLTGCRLTEHGTLVRLGYSEWEKLRQRHFGR